MRSLSGKIDGDLMVHVEPIDGWNDLISHAEKTDESG
jgi:hypothetical protein